MNKQQGGYRNTDEQKKTGEQNPQDIHRQDKQQGQQGQQDMNRKTQQQGDYQNQKPGQDRNR
jgi:hypothetical protein